MQSAAYHTMPFTLLENTPISYAITYSQVILAIYLYRCQLLTVFQSRPEQLAERVNLFDLGLPSTVAERASASVVSRAVRGKNFVIRAALVRATEWYVVYGGLRCDSGLTNGSVRSCTVVDYGV